MAKLCEGPMFPRGMKGNYIYSEVTKHENGLETMFIRPSVSLSVCNLVTAAKPSVELSLKSVWKVLKRK
jgi:hypothetical protein